MLPRRLKERKRTVCVCICCLCLVNFPVVGLIKEISYLILSYPPLPAQAPPGEVLPYTPSLSAAPESFPTRSPPSRLHAHGATHRGKKNFLHDHVLQ